MKSCFQQIRIARLGRHEVLGAMIPLTIWSLPVLAFEPINLTPVLASSPDVLERISQYCTPPLANGNEKACWLQEAFVVVDTIRNISQLRLAIKAKSRHVPMPGVVLYDFTETYQLAGTVDNNLCRIIAVSISADGDIAFLISKILEGTLTAVIRFRPQDFQVCP